MEGKATEGKATEGQATEGKATEGQEGTQTLRLSWAAGDAVGSSTGVSQAIAQ